MVYDFNYRKGYSSQDYLIEIIIDNDNKAFLLRFLQAIALISPSIVDAWDLWMNDEIMINVNTEYGKIDVSMDIWGFAFIMSNENENCIRKVYELLKLDSNFNDITNYT
ncbi:MAG: hypothetical protein LBP40_07730 [Campylobacteraceae bacterium]|jgi:hypothetical protein|nr:hypothetical protein [Campylobacteraceae bacterium]